MPHYGQTPYGAGVPPYGGWGWMPPLPPKPGVIPLGPPLGLGEILGGAFATLGRGWTHLLAVGSALYGGLLVLMGAMAGVGYLIFQDTIDTMVDLETWDPPGTDIAGLIGAGILVWLVIMVGSLYITGVLTALVYVLLEPAVVGHRLSVREAWGRANSRAWATVGTLLLTGLIIAVPVAVAITVIVLVAVAVGESSVGLAVLLGILLGLAALVYLLWMGVRLSMAPVAVVLEAASPVAALRRSAQLARGSWWRIFGIALLGYVIASTASQVLQLPVSFLLPIAGITFDSTGSASVSVAGAIAVMFVVVALSMLAGVFTNAFMQLIIGLLYVDRRIRTENLAPALLEAAGVQSAPQDQPPYPPAGGYPGPGRHA